ncbi:MAG TPA: SUMF1/EgtB/PvdO family nonheme iron enzyme [Candidatus Baltobacteraceae bacterium]|nr:SUMF1/EgtB/PvdO family nonheme iron enzyme [Candidatus Baltobacteraceae bacterium]
MPTLAASPVELDRSALRLRYLNNRNRSSELFSIFEPSAYETRPIPLRHPPVFYEGHIPAFGYRKLLREGLGAPFIDERLEVLFARGIDPASLDDAKRHQREEWPARSVVQAFGAECDAAILRALATADLTDERSPVLVRGQAAFTILEHEEMHHETFMYLMHRLPLERKRRRASGSAFAEGAPFASGRVAIPAGRATLGARRDVVEFGWDNEFDEHAVDVAAFEIDVNNVTNGEWLAFLGEGGPLPPFWLERDGAYRLLTQFEELALPLSWPVYVTQTQAAAYAAWRGARLPSEAEYHRAAFGTPDGSERAFPWGNDPPDARRHGNFDFRRYDPEPVGSSPAGASAWGVADLIGNGWEWTSTEFAPFGGFTPLASYPEYSADFFDGAHFIIKGASPVTNRHHIRRSFRNWYRSDYPYAYAAFRTVSD